MSGTAPLNRQVASAFVAAQDAAARMRGAPAWLRAHLSEMRHQPRSLRAHLAGIAIVATLPGLGVLVATILDRGLPAVEAMLAILGGFLLSLAWALTLAARLSAPLQALAAHARNIAADTAPGRDRIPTSPIVEVEHLRHGIERTEAVLRRRGAAERVALREARAGHELLVSVVNAAAECIYVKDSDLRYVLVNRAALLSGPAPLEEWQVLGRCASDIFPPGFARAIEAADAAVLSTGRMQSFEHALTMPDGAEHWIWMTITPWQDARGRIMGVVSVSRDVTTERAAAVRLRAMQADLLRATRLSAMGAMASGLAHELNQPLAAATNYLNAGLRLLERAAPPPDPAVLSARDAVADGVHQVLRAGDIVRRLRDFVSRGEAELQLEDMGELIREACDLARMDGVASGIELRAEVADSTGMALVDRTQIQQVLVNLVRNAGEAIASAHAAHQMDRPGEIVVSAGADPDGGMVIEVSDNGPGLAPGIADCLFQPFVSTKATGMGIGLAICHTIIQGHGGRLTAASREAGVVFRISLPAIHPVGGSEK